MAAWLILSIATTLPILIIDWLPLYDYPNWVFQGRIVADLITNHPDSAALVRPDYSLSWRPVPNLAAPLGIATFAAVLPPNIAGRLFLVVSVLFFAWAYGYLVRSVQGRPTAMELFGFPWACGYFFYKGYVSYLFSLPLAFIAIALLHRMSVRQDSRPSPRDLGLLAVLGSALYLSHLVGWLIFMLALLLYAGVHLREGRRRSSLALLSVAVPSVVMLLAYATTRASDSAPTLFYDHLLLSKDKLISLSEPVVLFLRADPFVPLLPTFWVNLGAFALLGALAIANLDGRRLPRQTLVFLAGGLAVLAIFIPVSDFRDLNRPDERFVLPALLIFIAIMRWKPFSLLRAGSLASVVLLIVGLRVVEDLHSSRLSQRISNATAASVPRDVRVFSLTLHDGPTRGGCASDGRPPSFGAATLRWIDLRRLEMAVTLRTTLLETSLVHEKRAADRPGVTVQVMTMDQLRSQTGLGEQLEQSYPYVEVFGCNADVAEATAILSDEYVAIARGSNYAVLRDLEAPPASAASR